MDAKQSIMRLSSKERSVEDILNDRMGTFCDKLRARRFAKTRAGLCGLLIGNGRSYTAPALIQRISLQDTVSRVLSPFCPREIT